MKYKSFTPKVDLKRRLVLTLFYTGVNTELMILIQLKNLNIHTQVNQLGCLRNHLKVFLV